MPAERANHGTLSGTELDAADHGTQRNLAQVQRVAHLGGYPLSGNYFLTYLKAGRSDDVTLLAVGVSQQSDECRTIGVVLYGFYRSRYSELVAFEIDDTITLFVTAADPDAWVILPVLLRPPVFFLRARRLFSGWFPTVTASLQLRIL